MKTLKMIPDFTSEDEEREFLSDKDSTKFIDWKSAEKVRFPNLKKSTKTISLRLPVDMLEELKIKANAIDLPYQSFIKMLLKKELFAE